MNHIEKTLLQRMHIMDAKIKTLEAYLLKVEVLSKHITDDKYHNEIREYVIKCLKHLEKIKK